MTAFSFCHELLYVNNIPILQALLDHFVPDAVVEYIARQVMYQHHIYV